MSTSITPHIGSLGAFTERAVKVAAEAKHLADSLRAEYARQLLHEHFPGHTLAVFARNWDEDNPALIQLLSANDAYPDLDLMKPAPDFDDLPQDKRAAVIEAEAKIVAIGADDDILEHLDPGAEEHQDWTEFVLYLDPNREGAATP